jgi:hypothetical protein
LYLGEFVLDGVDLGAALLVHGENLMAGRWGKMHPAGAGRKGPGEFNPCRAGRNRGHCIKVRFLYARKNEPGTGILGSSRNLGVFAQRREKDHSRVTAAKHVAKRNRFAPMFCDGKTGSNPASGPLSQNLRLLQHERSG